MATRDFSTFTQIFSDNLANLENEINATFDGIIARLDKRRSDVLDKLRLAMASTEKALASIKKLELKKTQESVDIGDALGDFHSEIISMIDKKISSLRLETQQYMFVCDVREVEKAISTLGEIILTPQQYVGKSKPIATYEIESELSDVNGMFVDEKLGMVAVTIRSQNKILLFTIEGKLVNQIQNKVFKKLRAIQIVSHEDIYVTDIGNDAIFKYKAENKSFKRIKFALQTKEPIEHPTGLCYDKFSDLLYVTLSNSHSIAILTPNLVRATEFYPELVFPQHIKTSQHEIYVLDTQNPCMHIISKTDLTTMRSVISRGLGLTLQLVTAFCLGRDGSILLLNIANLDTNPYIQVYSPNGHLIHVLAPEYLTWNIYVKENCDVITVSSTPKANKWAFSIF